MKYNNTNWKEVLNFVKIRENNLTPIFQLMRKY